VEVTAEVAAEVEAAAAAVMVPQPQLLHLHLLSLTANPVAVTAAAAAAAEEVEVEVTAAEVDPKADIQEVAVSRVVSMELQLQPLQVVTAAAVHLLLALVTVDKS